MIEYQIWSNYGYGWDEESCYDNRQEALDDLKAYRTNCPEGQYKLKKVRIKNA